MKFFFLLLFSFFFSSYSSRENELKTKLLNNYHYDNIPMINDHSPVDLKIGIALRAFNNINQIDGTINSNIWLRHWWNDYQLRWNSTEWGINQITFFTSSDCDRCIWVPDIYVYNTAENPLQDLSFSRAIIYPNGDIIWSRPGIMSTTCEFNLKDFPYDEQMCYFKFGSWSYHSEEVNLSIREGENIDTSNYQESDSWDLQDTTVDVQEKIYNCCPEKYQSVHYYFKIRRKPGFFILNIIIPTFATATLMILSLLIPWDSGERISFAITVMLSIIVFLLILSESLPKTNTKPLLSRMLIGLVFFSLFVVFFTVMISTIHSYSRKNKKFCQKLIRFFDRFNLSCKKQQNEIETNTENATELETETEVTENNSIIDRSNSYIESINLEKKEDSNELEVCDKLAEKLESFFTSIFFVSFIIYSAVVFNQKPG